MLRNRWRHPGLTVFKDKIKWISRLTELGNFAEKSQDANQRVCEVPVRFVVGNRFPERVSIRVKFLCICGSVWRVMSTAEIHSLQRWWILCGECSGEERFLSCLFFSQCSKMLLLVSFRKCYFLIPMCLEVSQKVPGRYWSQTLKVTTFWTLVGQLCVPPF